MTIAMARSTPQAPRDTAGANGQSHKVCQPRPCLFRFRAGVVCYTTILSSRPRPTQFGISGSPHSVT